jgi:hypothetical protein
MESVRCKTWFSFEVVRKNMMDRREVIKKYKNSLRPMGIAQVRKAMNVKPQDLTLAGPVLRGEWLRVVS